MFYDLLGWNLHQNIKLDKHNTHDTLLWVVFISYLLIVTNAGCAFWIQKLEHELCLNRYTITREPSIAVAKKNRRKNFSNTWYLVCRLNLNWLIINIYNQGGELLDKRKHYNSLCFRVKLWSSLMSFQFDL